MAKFVVSQDTDWIETIQVGDPEDRYRLDDYDIYIQLKRPDDQSAVLDINTENGRIIIVDPVNRRMEINVAWTSISTLGPGSFEFDILYVNRVTEIRDRSEIHTLTVARGISSKE